MVNISAISDIEQEFVVIFSPFFSDNAVEIPINMPNKPAFMNKIPFVNEILEEL